MENDIHSLYESLEAAESDREAAKIARELKKAGEDNPTIDLCLLSAKNFATPLKAMRAYRRARNKYRASMLEKLANTAEDDYSSDEVEYLIIQSCLARLALEAGDLKTAEKEAKEELDLSVDFPSGALLILGSIYFAAGRKKELRELRSLYPEDNALFVLSSLLKFVKDKDVDALRKRLIKANFFLYLILFGVCTFSKALVSVSESGEVSIDDHSLYAADYLLKSLRHAGYCTCSLFSEITRLAPKERERFLADPVNKAALSLLASFFEGDLDSGLKRKEAISFLMKEGLDEKKARKVLSRLVRAEILYKDGSSLYVGNDGTALYLVP